MRILWISQWPRPLTGVSESPVHIPTVFSKQNVLENLANDKSFNKQSVPSLEMRRNHKTGWKVQFNKQVLSHKASESILQKQWSTIRLVGVALMYNQCLGTIRYFSIKYWDQLIREGQKVPKWLQNYLICGKRTKLEDWPAKGPNGRYLVRQRAQPDYWIVVNRSFKRPTILCLACYEPLFSVVVN